MLEGVFEGGDPQLAEQSCTTTESTLFKYTETVPAINKLKNIMTVFVLPIQALDPRYKEQWLRSWEASSVWRVFRQMCRMSSGPSMTCHHASAP